MKGDEAIAEWQAEYRFAIQIRLRTGQTIVRYGASVESIQKRVKEIATQGFWLTAPEPGPLVDVTRGHYIAPACIDGVLFDRVPVPPFNNYSDEDGI